MELRSAPLQMKIRRGKERFVDRNVQYTVRKAKQKKLKATYSRKEIREADDYSDYGLQVVCVLIMAT